jgi:biopolymer transport protein ExbB
MTFLMSPWRPANAGSQGYSFHDFGRFAALLLTMLLATCVLPVRGTLAQDDAELAAELGLDDGAADPAPDAGDGAGVPGPGEGDTEDEGVKAPSNLLAWTFQALGIPYTVIFFALSITLLTLIVMNILACRQDNICPPDLIEGVEQQLGEGNAQGAAELVRTDDSFLGQVVAAGLSKLDRGYSHAIESMQEVGEEETMKIDHNLSYMALIGNISPMIGLFGTVQGMISAFRTIATSGSTPKPSQLAMDISTALFTTLAGLAIAIPAIAVYNILRNRVQRLTMQVGVTSEELLERFEG